MEEFDQLQGQLAELVLLLHEDTSSHYRRITETEAKRYEKWHECYHDIFDPIWRDVEKSSVLPIKSRKMMAKVHDHLESLLNHDDCPRLVHWDIWATNVLVRSDAGAGWRVSALLDPNCKYAHAEAEIAYMELFHTITPAFLKTYQQVHKLPAEYHRVRRQVYQLYSLLNHLHLFGQEYMKSYLGMLERVGSLL
jgi:fructosamine-3-kinase